MQMYGSDVESLVSLRGLNGAFEGSSVLVFGGAGFIGSWLCEALLAAGADLTVVDNFATGSPDNVKHLAGNPHFKLVKCEAQRFKTSERFDYVLNLAARPAPDDYVRHPVETLLTSAEGSLNALEIARKSDAVYLFTSTSEVYGSAEKVPTPEDYWGYVNPIGVRSCYDEGKRYAEALAMAYYRQYGLDVRISRIFNTYGPRLDARAPSSYGRVVVKFISQALRGEPITVYGDGMQTRAFLYIVDNVEAHILLLLKREAKGQVVNIGSTEEVTILKLASIIRKLTGSSSPIVHLPPRPDDPRRRCPDISKARQLLGWEPKTPLIEGLKRTIEWLKPRVMDGA